MRRAAACLVAWLSVALACSAGNETARGAGGVSSVDSLVRLGDSTYRQDHDSARRLWERALTEATAQGDSANVARALTGIAMAARLTGDWDESRRIGELALAIKERQRMGARDLFRSYNALALLAWNQERLSDATALLERAGVQARVLGDSSALGMVAINTGLVAKDVGAFARSRQAFLAGREITRSSGDSVNLGRALVNLAMLDIAMGDPIAAIGWIEESRRLARLTGDSITEVNARGQLAHAYSALGEPQRAFALLDSALTMAQRSGRRQEVAEDLLLIGDLFVEAGDHQNALAYFQRARAALDTLHQPEEHGNILRSEAQALASLGNLSLARVRAVAALATHRASEFGHAELSDLIVLADLAQRDGQTSQARIHLGEADRLARRLEAPIAATAVAIARARVAAQAREWTVVLDAIQGTRGTLHLAGASGEAEAHALQARALGELGRFEAALVVGREAIRAIDQIRGNYSTGELRTTFTSARADVFAQQALLLLRLGRTSEAFEVADAARGRALLEHLGQARAELQTVPGTGTLIEQDSLLRRIDAFLSQLRARERDTPPRERSSEHRAVTAGLRDSVETLRSAYSALIARGAANGSADQAVVGLARPGTDEIRRSLQHGEVLLEYLVTPDRLLIFVVDSSGVVIHAVDERATALTSRVQLARELLRRPDGEVRARGVLRALFDLTLAPVERSGALRNVKRLIVVPHAVLTYLPFAALIQDSSYVVEHFELLQLPTSAALPALRASAVQAPRQVRAAIFAPTPEALPATRREAKTVTSVLRGSALHIGSRATEGRVRLALQEGGVVHIASHATLNGRNPLFSHIELAGARGGSSANNGRLEAHELLGLRIDAPLVFLSGCETAVGGSWSTRYDSGEDYAALAQTFLYAGARNVVATLWRIDDDGAAEFARHFYEGLTESGYPEALAKAQRRMIADSRYRSPYYWAAYQVSGGGQGTPANGASLSDK